MRAPLWWCCLCLLGCESTGEVIVKQRPAVERQFAAVRSLGPRVKAVQPQASPQSSTAPVVLERSGTAESNAAFVYAQDLDHPGEAAPVRLRTLDSVPLLRCGSLLAKGRLVDDPDRQPSPSLTASTLAACARLRYALVIREQEFTPPRLVLETRHFVPGVYRADVLAFELATGTLVGAYPVSVRSEGSVDLANEDDERGHLRRLISHLESDVYEALRDGARATFPGSLGPRH